MNDDLTTDISWRPAHDVPALAQQWSVRVRAAVPYSIGFVATVTTAVMLAWLCGTVRLRQQWPALFVMKFNTSLVLLLLDIAVLGLYRPTRAARLLVWSFAVAALGVSVCILLEYALHMNLGIDQMIVADYAPAQFPGRTSPPTATCSTLIALAILFTQRKRFTAIAQPLLIAASTMPMVVLSGYLYRTPGLSSSPSVPIIAVHTALCQILLCVSIFFIRPDVGLMRVLVSNSLAGSITRKLLPLAIVLPLFVGFLVTVGEHIGLFSVQFGSALLVSCCALFFAAAVWLSMSLLWKMEKVRCIAESRLRESEQQLRLMVEERDDLLTHERASRLAVEHASRMKDEFLATLSHELRTPLNAILGWAQILRSEHDGQGDLTDGLATIERNARAQTRIVEDLLDMSRIISGKLKLNVQFIQLDAVIRAAVETVQAAADAKSVLLVTNAKPDLGTVRADPNRLQQVIWNLLSNSIRFTPKGGRVYVKASRVKSQLHISVSDSGEGIATDFLPYVFDRFRQADSSTTRRHGGLGLGLAIVKQLVELHGGSVAVDSDGVGHGATFTIMLPMSALSSEASVPAGLIDNSPGVIDPPPRVQKNLSGLKVLVVDDELDARLMLKRILMDCDASVEMAGSALEAIEMLQKELPDVLVSDIGMPGEDGYALIRRVRQLKCAEGGETPALALTAYSRSDDRAQAMHAGFQMHLSKPAEPTELIAIIERLGKTLKEAV